MSLAGEPFSWLGRVDLWMLYAVLLGLSFLKYTAPFVPGDILMLSAVFLVGMKAGSGWISASAIALGGTIGALAAYAWGHRYGRKFLHSVRLVRLSERVERLLGRWGFWPLVLNRFVPYVRPILFPAAGMLGMAPAPVAASAVASNILFGAFLALLGHTAGREWSRFASLYQLYQTWLGGAVFAVLAVLAGYLLYGAWRARRTELPPD